MVNLRLSKSSRYTGTPLYRLSDNIGQPTNSFIFGVWSRPEIKDTISDVIHYVEQHEIGRMDLIANKYYSDSLLWWAIADRNNILDPITDMYSSQELRIPSLAAIRSAIQNAASRRF
jgi:hypothetical protein